MATVVKAAKLIDGRGGAPIDNPVILIEGERIREVGPLGSVVVPPGATEIDLGNRTILPGLVDAHIHFFGVDTANNINGLLTDAEAYRALRALRDADRMLRAGFTSVSCKGSSIGPYLRRAIDEGIVQGPRVVAAGQFICQTHGTWDLWPDWPRAWVEALNMLADGEDACRQMVRRRMREGAQFVKIGLSAGIFGDHDHAWGDSPTAQTPNYSLAEVRAMTDEAHRCGLTVSAHCIGDEAVRSALEGGVDVIEHAHGINDETRRMLVDRGVTVVSTLTARHVLVARGPRFGVPEAMIRLSAAHRDRQIEDFQKSLRAGVRYALGTDLIGPPVSPLGLNAIEFELVVEAGMTPGEAIVAGTRIAAEAIGLGKDVGTVERGKYADLIAVDGDPLRNIKLLQRVAWVMKGGKVIDRPLSPDDVES